MWFWTKKKDTLVREDKVWMHSAARYLNLTNDLKASYTGQSIFLTAFFGETYDQLAQLLIKTGIPFNECTGRGQLSAGQINLIPAEILSKENPEKFAASQQQPLQVFLPEHHPLYSVERDFLNIFEPLGNNVICRFYLALDDPFFKLFGSQNIENMMHKLGMTETEHLTHPLISKAIENAQKKTEKKATKSFNADSAEEWYKKNMS